VTVEGNGLKQGPQNFDLWLKLKLKFGNLKWGTLKQEG